MRSLMKIATAALALLLASAALAQVRPTSSTRPGGGPVGLDKLPAALQFEVVRSRSKINGRGERLLIHHTTAAYPQSAQRLKQWQETSRNFGGGYRILGWTHQTQGDKWWYRVLAPDGAKYTVGLERDSGGGTIVTVNTHGGYGPEVKARRAYRRDDLGPKP